MELETMLIVTSLVWSGVAFVCCSAALRHSMVTRDMVHRLDGILLKVLKRLDGVEDSE
jgi:hypothetical protein